MIALFFIVILPIAYNLYLAFTKWTIGLGQPRFIGFGNFIELISDERVRNGVKVMIYFSGLSLSLELVFGLLIAFTSTVNSRAAKSFRPSTSFRLQPHRWRSH